MGREHKRFYKKASAWIIIGLVASTLVMTSLFVFYDNQSYIEFEITANTYEIEQMLGNVSDIRIMSLGVLMIKLERMISVWAFLNDVLTSRMIYDFKVLGFTNESIASIKGSTFVLKITPDCSVTAITMLINYQNDLGNRMTTTFEEDNFENVDENTTQAEFEAIINTNKIPRGMTATYTVHDLRADYDLGSNRLVNNSYIVSRDLYWNPFNKFVVDPFNPFSLI